MADLSQFRSSLGGFHRGDVVDFIETTSAAHQKELRSAQDEAEKLRVEQDVLLRTLQKAERERDEAKAALEEARQELNRLREEDASLQQQIEDLAMEAAQLAEEKRLLQEEAEDAEEAEEAAEDAGDGVEGLSLPEKELEAYRRAEAMERNTLFRAGRLRGQMETLCDTARSRCQDSGEEISALCDDIGAVLVRLQEALADVRVIFDDTENAFDELRLPDGGVSVTNE